MYAEYSTYPAFFHLQVEPPSKGTLAFFILALQIPLVPSRNGPLDEDPTRWKAENLVYARPPRRIFAEHPRDQLSELLRIPRRERQRIIGHNTLVERVEFGTIERRRTACKLVQYATQRPNIGFAAQDRERDRVKLVSAAILQSDQTEASLYCFVSFVDVVVLLVPPTCRTVRFYRSLEPSRAVCRP